jgi:hypothetical protein
MTRLGSDMAVEAEGKGKKEAGCAANFAMKSSNYLCTYLVCFALG